MPTVLTAQAVVIHCQHEQQQSPYSRTRLGMTPRRRKLRRCITWHVVSVAGLPGILVLKIKVLVSSDIVELLTPENSPEGVRGKKP